MTRSGITAIILGGLCVALLCVKGLGQADPSGVPVGGEGALPPPFTGPLPPQTRLEGLASQKSVLLIKGYTDIGQIQADDGSVLRVTAVEFADAAGQARERGLAVAVQQRGGGGGGGEEDGGSGAFAYVDYDEIDALGAALETLVKLDLAASPLANFEGQYRTRGDLEFSNHNSNGGRVITVRTVQVLLPSAQVLTAAASFRPARLAEFRQQIATAKEMLDRPREQAGK